MKKSDEKILDLEVKNLIREEQEKIVDKAITVFIIGVCLVIFGFGKK